MKKPFTWLSCFLSGLLLVAVLAIPALADSIEDPVATESWLLQILNWLTQIKGMSTLALAAGVVQLLMVGFRTPLAEFTGRFRFMVVSLLSLAAVVMGGMATGLTFMQSMASGAALAAAQVFVNQAWKQLFTPKGN